MNEKHILDIRAFNRFYTGIIGLLDSHILNSQYTLPEVRIMYELYQHAHLTASGIITLLGIDKSYLSRILRKFEKEKLMLKDRSATDARSVHLRLSQKGKKAFLVLNEASGNQIKKMLERLDENQCDSLLHHMNSIKKILFKTISNEP